MPSVTNTTGSSRPSPSHNRVGRRAWRCITVSTTIASSTGPSISAVNRTRNANETAPAASHHQPQRPERANIQNAYTLASHERPVARSMVAKPA
jgi:hypothetical protein